MKKIALGFISLFVFGFFIVSCTGTQTAEPLPTSTLVQQPSLEPTEVTILDDLSAIKIALAEKLGEEQTGLLVTGATITGEHARGDMEGGYFLAAKVGNDWVIVYSGQETPLCDSIAPYDFPVDMVPECMGEDNSLVDRSAPTGADTNPTASLDEEAILQAVAVHIGKDLATIKASVNRMEGDIAMGGVESGYFLAAREGDTWKIVYDGQATPSCYAIAPYNYPVEWVPECIDAKDNLVDRSNTADEEPTETPGPEEMAILESVAEYLGRDLGEFQAEVNEIEGQTATGSIENGYFLAAKSSGDWLIVYAGQATPACSAVDPYDFSADMVPECQDDNNNLVNRSGTDVGMIRDALGTPDWKDDLNNSAYWYLVNTGNVKFSMGEGVLVMNVKQAGLYEEWGLANVPQLDNIYLEVEFETGDSCSGKDRYGVLFRAPDPSMGYVYEFSCDGRYRVYKWDGSHYAPLQEWTSSPFIKSGPGQRNIMGVKADGDVFELYANGQYLAEVRDETFDVGRFGLLIGSDQTNDLVIYVDSVAYWFIDG